MTTKKPHILVVDDQRFIRKRIAMLLASYQAEITEAEDGVQAFELLQRQAPFDLILSDIEMPEMNGYALCKKVKDDPLLRKIPLILVSSFDTDYSIEQGFASGADAFVSKLDVLERLPALVGDFLSRSRGLQKRRLLVAEDSEPIRKLIAGNLRESGFQVDCVGNGREALAMLGRENFDLIVSDLVMPEMDGFTLCDKIKTDKRLAGIPLIIMTSLDDQGTINRLKHQAIAGFILKPFHPAELLILIERIFSEKFQLLLKENENLLLERNLLLHSITSLANALEARDKYTQGHSEAVAGLVTGMARLAGGVTAEDLDLLEIGGRLHDIGKIGIRDAVLLKEGKLTDEEYDHIKAHPKIGANILRAIPSMAKIIPIVLHHHERYDGKGYPLGLKGADIPFWARLTAVADAYDAMTSNRPYRAGMPHEKAVSIIREVSGAQLCPECVELFLRYMDTSPEMTRPKDGETARIGPHNSVDAEDLF